MCASWWSQLVVRRKAWLRDSDLDFVDWDFLFCWRFIGLHVCSTVQSYAVKKKTLLRWKEDYGRLLWETCQLRREIFVSWLWCGFEKNRSVLSALWDLCHLGFKFYLKPHFLLYIFLVNGILCVITYGERERIYTTTVICQIELMKLRPSQIDACILFPVFTVLSETALNQKLYHCYLRS